MKAQILIEDAYKAKEIIGALRKSGIEKKSMTIITPSKDALEAIERLDALPIDDVTPNTYGTVLLTAGVFAALATLGLLVSGGNLDYPLVFLTFASVKL